MKSFNISIQEIIQAYVEERIPINIEGLNGVTREDFISAGYEAVGDPEDHELLEKYYAISRKKGINFKLYLLCGEIWSSGMSFYGFSLREVLESIETRQKIRVFAEEDLKDGALIIGSHIVCRFSLKCKAPRALTFETDSSTIEALKGRNIATYAVLRSFEEVDLEAPLRNTRLKKLRDLIRETHSD